jgi:integrase
MAQQHSEGAPPAPAQPKKPRQFPVEIWAGLSLIRILHDPLFIPIKPRAGEILDPHRKVVKKKYDSYLVEYPDGSKAARKRRSTYDKARALADQIKVKLLNNEVDATRLVGRDQQIYLAAMEHLKGVVDAPLDQIAKEYADATKMLAPYGLTVAAAMHQLEEVFKRLNGTPLSTVVEFYDLHGTTIVAEKTVKEVLDEMLAALKKDGVGDYHRRDLRLRLTFFAESFPGKISAITTSQIDNWLRDLKSRSKESKGADLKGKSRNNYRRSIVELFNYARRNRYLPTDLSTAADHTKAVKEITAENEFFTPEEMETLLSTAAPTLLPSLAIKAFSGVRTEEMIVLTWEMIKFDQKCIILGKQITKLDQRRIIPLKANLEAWLLPYRKEKGRICELWTAPNSVAHAWKRHGITVGVKTGKNKFRNSYISYRVAETKDPKTVAFESGNSPGTIARDYLEITTPQEAEKWFSIFPSKTHSSGTNRPPKKTAQKPTILPGDSE